MCNLVLIGILVGAFPTLQSPNIPLNRKVVPAIFSFLVLACLDWSDWGIILFLGSAVVTNWIYQRDILNYIVDNIMVMLIYAKNKITEAIEDILTTAEMEDKIVNEIEDY